MSDSGTRRDHDVENTRQQILDAAREVFVASGYESTSIREVARRAGISHGTIYLHFRDKDDLLYQVSEDEFSKLLGRLRSLPRAQDPIQRLAGALKVFGTYGLDFPHQYQLMMGYRPASFSAGDTPRFGAMAEQVSAFLGDLIREARKRSIVSGDAATLDHLSLIAIVHGTVDMFFLQLVSRDAAEAALDHSIALMLGAMTDDGCALEHTEGEGNGA